MRPKCRGPCGRSLTNRLTIIPGPLSIATTSLPAGNAGSVYSATLTAAGGTSPYSWTLDSGSLPAGLSLSSAGVISGTPASSGSASFTVRVTDSQASPASVTRALTLQVNPAVLVISTSALPNGATGTAYSTTLVASGGIAPYTWTIASGSLPAGLALDPGGVISGTPTAAVAASFTVRVTDSQGSPATATRALTLTTTGSAQVFWTAPTLRDDTSNLTDLAGFKVYYGTSAGSLGNVQQVANPSATGVTISGLAAGTWFFAVTAYDSGNVESIRTTVVSGTVP